MIVNFEVTNVRSFKDTASLFASKRSLKTNHPRNGDWNSATHRAIGIFGANASGKTTLLHSLRRFIHVISLPIGASNHLKFLHAPHKLHQNEDSSYFLDFVHKHKRFRWEMALSTRGVVYESVEVSESRQWKLIFEREGEEFTFGSGSKISKAGQTFIDQASGPWVSAVSAWVAAKGSGDYAPAFVELAHTTHEINASSIHHGANSDFVASLLSESAWNTTAKSALNFADLEISDVKVIEEEFSPREEEFLKKVAGILPLTTEGKTQEKVVLPDKKMSYEMTHIGPDGKTFTLEDSEESAGTLNWMEMAVPALFTIVEGGVLLIDEIESSLHPLLVRQLISMFTNDEINHSGAQLLFTSHDLTLLGNLPRPAIDMEAAWLVEKQESYSAIKSLDEYKLPKTANAEKRYLQGAFGAIPRLPNPNVEHEFMALLDSLEQSMPKPAEVAELPND